MLFNSLTFLIFFILIVPTYFLMPYKFRWIHLLISSYIFYMFWNPTFILLIIFSTASDYILSWKIYNSTEQKQKKLYLLTSLTINFSLLFLFKYSVFINESFMFLYVNITSLVFELTGNTKEVALEMANNLLSNYPLREYSIILPMGISFYTFQVVAYVVDVYRGIVTPIRHYGIFSLYITFFPQLVAGPIERSKNLIPQFYKKHTFDKERALYGLKIMMYGFFKKIVIADRLSVGVNTIYGSPELYSGLYLILASIMFAIQLYCDFSGYSDIAVGTAKVLGFELSKNFKNPFLSKSIKELWQRWHISLNSWFTDYVYIPLGGNRTTKLKHMRNLFLTFLVSGLWHGANWTYLIWGGLNGIFIIIETYLTTYTSLISKKLIFNNKLFNISFNFILDTLKILLTFLMFTFSLIFFRATSISDSIYILSNLFTDISISKQYLYEVITSLGLNLVEILTLVLSIGFLFLCELFSGKRQVYNQIEKMKYPYRLAFYVVISTFILTTGVFYATGEFIYFQF